MKLWCAIVVLAASLPHAKVWGAVSPLNIVHKVLYEGDFIHGVDDLQP